MIVLRTLMTAPNPCDNGGTCTDQVYAFSCACTHPWMGTTCGTGKPVVPEWMLMVRLWLPGCFMLRESCSKGIFCYCDANEMHATHGNITW